MTGMTGTAAWQLLNQTQLSSAVGSRHVLLNSPPRPRCAVRRLLVFESSCSARPLGLVAGPWLSASAYYSALPALPQAQADADPRPACSRLLASVTDSYSY